MTAGPRAAPQPPLPPTRSSPPATRPPGAEVPLRRWPFAVPRVSSPPNPVELWERRRMGMVGGRCQRRVFAARGRSSWVWRRTRGQGRGFVGGGASRFLCQVWHYSLQERPCLGLLLPGRAPLTACAPSTRLKGLSRRPRPQASWIPGPARVVGRRWLGRGRPHAVRSQRAWASCRWGRCRRASCSTC